MVRVKPLSYYTDLDQSVRQTAATVAGAQQTQGYPTYQKSDAVKQAEELLKQHTASRPSAYSSKYRSQIDNIASQLANREPFKYDVNGDALYQQYKDRYIHNGQRAMQDTMGQAAALTGGYGSSYAQNVGQQAYNEYMMGLNDVIPELQQLALDKYDRETSRLQNQYALYSDLDAQDYSRWQDDQNAYYNELQRLTEDARYKSEMDYSQYASEYEAYQKRMEAAQEDDKGDEPYKLQKYKFAHVDENGKYQYYLGDKLYSFDEGVNPHSGLVNSDIEHGTFGASGYQPNNIKGEKLTWTGQYATMNGHQQKVWMLPNGTLWMWDDKVNRYVQQNGYVEVDNTAAIKNFVSVLASKREFGNNDKGKYDSYENYNAYVEAMIDEWLTAGKMSEGEAATMMLKYGLI